jgi:hypothetical protein
MKLSKSGTFKTAWEYARYSAKKFGGSSKQYFSECLKRVYRSTARTLNDAIYDFLQLGNKFCTELVAGGESACAWLEKQYNIVTLMVIGAEFKVFC